MAASLLLGLAAQPASADDYPSRPVRIIVPYAAGGPSDTGARLIVDPLAKQLGQPVFIENRGGGGGLNATEAYFNADADGYTILLGGIAPLTIIPAAKKVSYVAERDFIPLGTVWRSAQVLAIRPTLGARTMAEFVTYAKANPGKVTIGSAGIGTVSHLAMELLKREAGIEVTHVPFRSTGASLPTLLGGQIDGLFGDASILAPHVQAGTIVVLGVAAAHRSPALPGLPTMGEAGFAGVEAEGWHGLGVSSRTPAVIVARLREAVTAAQKDPAFVDGLSRQGATAGEPGPDSLAALIRNDTKKWGSIVASAKVTIE